MNILVVIPIKYLVLEDDFEFDFDGYKLTNNLEAKKELIELKGFKEHFGILHCTHILQSPILYFKGETSNLHLPEEADSLYKIASLISNNVPRMIDCLWFIRDNSCSVSLEYYHCFDNNEFSLNDPNSSCCDHIGNYTSTTFNVEEFHICRGIYRKIADLLYMEAIYPPALDESKVFNTVPNPLKSLPYNFNRIAIGLNFLLYARRDSSVIVKITSFVAVLESLFSTKSGTPYSWKVPKKAASYVAEDDENTAFAYFHFLREAYGIRSDYIHGNTVNIPRSRLEYISRQVDAITRYSFIKALATDTDIFMPEQRERFGNHFATMVEKFKHVFPPEPEKKCK